MRGIWIRDDQSKNQSNSHSEGPVPSMWPLMQRADSWSPDAVKGEGEGQQRMR